MKKLLLIIAALIVLGIIYFMRSNAPKDAQEEDFKRGPHQGRLLENGDFQAEVTIFEPKGVPPKFRIYFYEKEKAIKPSLVSCEMELTRINRVEKVVFLTTDDFLESVGEASEPHSFHVKLDATYEGKQSTWEFESFEGRVELTPEMIAANHIKVEEAKPINMEIKLDVMGRLMPNEELTVYLSPRFPGVVKAVNKKLGDQVKKGDILAVIESNESLRNYEIRAEIDGTIIKKNINLGMYLTGQETIFVISDTNSIWADFNVYCQNLSRVKVGDPIQIKSLDGNLQQRSTISYISPIGDESTQSVLIRSVVSNKENMWKPGLFISGEVTIESIPETIAIRETALQTYRDGNVVFISKGNLFEVAPVEVGKINKDWVEIKSGLLAGDSYVTENSFILKADLEKSGAVHEH